MIVKTRGVVLTKIKYNDTAVIVHIYTNTFGRASYIVNIPRSRKKQSVVPFFEPLQLIEFETIDKPKSTLKRLNDLRVFHVYNSLNNDFYKSSVALFIAEALSKLLNEETQSSELFDFVVTSLVQLDEANSKISLFAPWFLIHLTQFLGFYPLNNYSSYRAFFDYSEGQFTGLNQNSVKCADKNISNFWSKILESDNFIDISSDYDRQTRNSMLESVLYFYKIHFDSFNEMKSLQILRDVFD
jgi:DNA repair protein RecO (recombination protein O)